MSRTIRRKTATRVCTQMFDSEAEFSFAYESYLLNPTKPINPKPFPYRPLVQELNQWNRYSWVEMPWSHPDYKLWSRKATLYWYEEWQQTIEYRQFNAAARYKKWGRGCTSYSDYKKTMRSIYYSDSGYSHGARWTPRDYRNSFCTRPRRRAERDTIAACMLTDDWDDAYFPNTNRKASYWYW